MRLLLHWGLSALAIWIVSRVVPGFHVNGPAAALIAAVQQRWYDLLDSTRFAQRSGKVILEFRLFYDGRITDIKVDGNEVGEMLGLLCQRAIIDPSPFPQWPSDMRRAIGKNYRDVQFTFYYN